MKRMLIAGGFAGGLALAAAGQALAADLPQPAPLPPRAPATYIPAVAPVYNWGGVYVGINGGWGFGSSDWTDNDGYTSGRFNPDGFLIGGTLGFNFQTGGFVFGVEGDGDWTDINGNTGGGCGGLPGGGGVTCETKNDWLATIRGRLGYAFDRVLLYGTAGGAGGNVESGFSGGSFDSSDKFGWTVGGGLEFGITPNLTAKVEYLYVDLGSGSCSSSCAGLNTPVSVSFTQSLVRAGLNAKFSF